MLKGSFIFFYLLIILEKIFHPQVKAKKKNHVNIMKQCRFLFLVPYLVEVNNALKPRFQDWKSIRAHKYLTT